MSATGRRPARTIDAWSDSYELESLGDSAVDEMRIYVTEKEARETCEYNGWQPVRIRILMWAPGASPKGAEK